LEGLSTLIKKSTFPFITGISARSATNQFIFLYDFAAFFTPSFAMSIPKNSFSLRNVLLISFKIYFSPLPTSITLFLFLISYFLIISMIFEINIEYKLLLSFNSLLAINNFLSYLLFLCPEIKFE